MLWFGSWKETKFVSSYVEYWVLENLSTICILLVWYLSWILIVKWLWLSVSLSYEFLYTMIWTIIVFWYTYKRYERDKELEIIKYYVEKYDKIIDLLEAKKSRRNYQKLVNLWYEEFYLVKRSFISRALWEKWMLWIEQDIQDLLAESFCKFSESGWNRDPDYSIHYDEFLWVLSDSWEVEIHKALISEMFLEITDFTMSDWFREFLERIIQNYFKKTTFASDNWEVWKNKISKDAPYFLPL